MLQSDLCTCGFLCACDDSTSTHCTCCEGTSRSVRGHIQMCELFVCSFGCGTCAGIECPKWHSDCCHDGICSLQQATHTSGHVVFMQGLWECSWIAKDARHACDMNAACKASYLVTMAWLHVIQVQVVGCCSGHPTFPLGCCYACCSPGSADLGPMSGCSADYSYLSMLQLLCCQGVVAVTVAVAPAQGLLVLDQ